MGTERQHWQGSLMGTDWYYCWAVLWWSVLWLSLQISPLRKCRWSALSLRRGMPIIFYLFFTHYDAYTSVIGAICTMWSLCPITASNTIVHNEWHESKSFIVYNCHVTCCDWLQRSHCTGSRLVHWSVIFCVQRTQPVTEHAAAYDVHLEWRMSHPLRICWKVNG